MRRRLALLTMILGLFPNYAKLDTFTYQGKTFQYNTCPCGQARPQRSKREASSAMKVGDIFVDHKGTDDFDLNFHINLNLSKLFNKGEGSLGPGLDDYLDNFDKNFNFDQSLVEVEVVSKVPKYRGMRSRVLKEPSAERTSSKPEKKSKPKRKRKKLNKKRKSFRNFNNVEIFKPKNSTVNEYEPESMKLVGGVEADPGEAPWQVLLENMNNGEICGGSILNPRFILTAAHCIDSFENARQTFKEPFPENILILLEQPELCKKGNVILPSGTRRVLKTIIHHLYNKEFGPKKQPIYDFALVLVSKSMFPFHSKLMPICLPPVEWWDNHFINLPVKVTGYGRIEGKLDTSRDQTACNLMSGNLKVIPPRDPACESLSSYPQIHMCGFHPETDACQGDSGGPLTYQSGTTFYQIGTVSYGNKDCSRKDVGTVFGRLTKVLPWVIAMINGGECGNNPTYSDK